MELFKERSRFFNEDLQSIGTRFKFVVGDNCSKDKFKSSPNLNSLFLIWNRISSQSGDLRLGWDLIEMWV